MEFEEVGYAPEMNAARAAVPTGPARRVGARNNRVRGPFHVQVPFELLKDPNVDAISIAVYCVLKMHADFGKTVGSRVSDGAAAKLAGVSQRSLRSRRDTLRSLGWIDWEQVKGRPNRYVIRNSPASRAPRLDLGKGPGETGSDETTPAAGAGVPRHQLPPSKAAVAEDPRHQVPTTDSHNREPIPISIPLGGAGAPGGYRSGGRAAGGSGRRTDSWCTKAFAAWNEVMGGTAPRSIIGRLSTPGRKWTEATV
jgi:hypothetical protein